jgi:hypothetical protein
LSFFADESFDLIFHPVSNLFVESLKPVWKECFRVLRWNGSLLSGFMNPTFYLFDHDEVAKTGKLEVKYSLPYSDLRSLSAGSLDQVTGKRAYEFGHTLEDQIGGQLAVGFVICDFYEDHWDDQATPLDRFIPLYAATLARKIRLSGI